MFAGLETFVETNKREYGLSIKSRFPLVRVLSMALCLFAVISLRAQTLDTMVFGNSTSENNHGLAASFFTVTPASVVAAGGGTTPSDPSNTAPSTTVTGALGLTGRQLLPRTPNADLYGGQITFTMAVDPVNQNYFTIKLWGGDDAANEWFVLDCNGLEVGSRHGSQSILANSEGEILWNYNTPWAPNAFMYRTRALPLSMTQGQTSVILTIRSMGWLSYYDSSGYFNHYAKLMNSPSPTMYGVYTHTGSFLDTSSETQGSGVTPVTPAPGITASQAISTIESNVNSTVASYLTATPGALNPDQIDYLAQTYGAHWSTYSGSPAVVAAVVADIDGLVTAYSAAPSTYMGNFVDSSWGGYFGPIGDAIRLIWPQINTGTTMSTVVNYGGALGSTTRTAAWSAALRASVDFGRFNRKTYTNQILSTDSGIYLGNRALELVDPGNALLESEALRYLHEGTGLIPYLGSDQPGEGQVPVYGTGPFGPNWYDITSKGTSKEPGFVGSDYGEIGAFIFRLGVIAGDSNIQAQGLKVLKARANFRYTGIDANGYELMLGAEPVGDRNDQDMPGHPAYLGRFGSDEFLVAAQGPSVVGNAILGYFQQGLNSGQAWPQVVAAQYGNLLNATSQLPLLPDYWTAASTQAQTGVLLPQTQGAGLPDYAWADEENMVVSAKHGSGATEESFYVNMNWLAPPYINGMAKIFDWTPTQARNAEIQVQDEQFDDSGVTLYGSNVVDWDETPWDNPQSAYGGIPYAEAIRPDLTELPATNADGGRGTAYTMRYGNWLVGVDASPTQSYTMKLPSDFTSATDLISGSTMSGPVTLSPKTSAVFYLPNDADPCSIPTFPLDLRYSATASSVTLNWSAAAGAASYNLSRSTTSGSGFTVVASGITATTYTDSIVVSASNAPYYVVTASNSCGTSAPSTQVGPVQSTALPSQFSNQDIGTVAIAGSSTYSDGVYSVSGAGADIGSGSDDFQFAYTPVTSDGDFIVRLTSSQAQKAGLMIRAALTPTSPMAMVMLDSGMGLARFATRPNDSNFANYTNGPAVSELPLWLRLNKSGATVTAYSSVNGINWTNIGSATVSYSAQYYVGFAVTSRESAPALAQFDSFLGVAAAGNSLPLAMTDLDIGSVGTAGLTTYANGFYDTNASGTGVASTADSFHFSYAPVSTDGDYITEVLNQDAMQEGIMVRSSLAANSAMAMVSLSNLYINFNARASAGAAIATVQSVASSNPIFLRLNKSGTTLTAYYSLDGYNWTQIGSTTIAIGTPFYVGLATASGSSATASGMFTGLAGVPAPLNFQVSPLSTNYQEPVTATVTVASTQSATPSGTASIYDWGTLLTTLPLSSGTATWSVSPSLLAGVHNLQAVYSGDTNYPQETSPVQAATVTLAPGQSGPCPLPNAPQNVGFTANSSQVFLTWSAVIDTLSYTVSRSLASGGGFTAVASGITSSSYTDSYSTSPTNAPYYLITAVNACGSSPASMLIGPVQSTVLPSNFTNQDVGSVQTVGHSSYTNGVYTVDGSGVDIGGTADSFQYAYSLVSSDGDFITRLVNTNAVKAGLMIRASLTAASPMAMVMLNSGMARFADRPASGNYASYSNGPAVNSAPVWLRLNKLGGTVTAYSSLDGVNWTKIGSASVTYGSQYYVGFAVTSWSSTLAAGQFDNFMGVPTPANALPTAFTSLDIGTVGTAGRATYASSIGEYDVFGSGSDIGGTSDSFQFSYVAMNTDGDYIAKILNQDAVKEGIMVRASLSGNSPMAMVMLNSGMERFAGRPNTGNYASYSNGPNVSTVPIWLRLNKSGGTVTGYTSVDKVNWTKIGSVSISFGSQFYVGFAVTSSTTQTEAGMFSSLSGVPAPLSLQLSTTSATYNTSEAVTVTPVNTQGVTPTGTVSVFDSGTLLNTFNISSGTATGTISPALMTGTHSLTAIYSGDAIYPQQTSVPQTVTVTQATPAIVWPAPATIVYGTALGAAQLDASSNAQGTFTYTPAAGTVLSAGTQTLSVAFAPTDTVDYTAASQTVQLTVSQAATSLVFSTNPAILLMGQAETLTATVSGPGAPTGTVVFTSGSATLCSAALNASGTASCSFTPATGGALTLASQYQGDANHLSSSYTQNLFVYDGAVTLQAANTQLVYPGATNLTACIASKTSTSATGTVQIFDGSTLLTTQSVQGGGCAYWYISPGLNAGAHPLTAVYSGDANNISGTSVPIAINVQPVPVTLSPSCWNSNYPYGANYQCTVSVSSNAGSPLGSVTYAFDGGAPATVALSNGNAQFSIALPPAGTHTVVIGYVPQTNYAAATPVMESFTVTAAPVNISLTPSSWYTSASGSVTFVAAIASWSAGPPNAAGSVAFYDGSTLLVTVPVNASGQASYATSTLPVGQQTITATYSGGANYASGSSSVTITLTQ